MAQFRKDTHQYLTQETTIFEVVMLSDQYGNLVGPANPSGTAVDAFGRARISSPITLFDSFHRYQDNGKFNDANSATGSTITYNTNSSTVSLNVRSSVANSYVYRESSKVFSYQPGKSLHILKSFCMAPAQIGLRQRIGYFGTQNGIYLEQVDQTINFVIRSYSTGTLVEDRIPQNSWNIDKLDGTGPSLLILDLTKTQIFWCDIEWLGVGAVRVGFVINGQLITAHTFYNANSLTTVYMQTANLPIRYEIERAGTLTAGTYTLQQICSSCISEGGYSPQGLEEMIGTGTVSAGVNLPTANTYYNIATIKIRASRPYAVIVPAGVDILNISNGDFEWGLFINATPSSAFSYTNFSDNVQYDLTTVDLTSTGTRVAGGYLGGKTAPFTLGGDFIAFANQLGQTIGGVSDTLTLGVRPGTANGDVSGLLKWFDLT
jgi:hypothetical protein